MSRPEHNHALAPLALPGLAREDAIGRGRSALRDVTTDGTIRNIRQTLAFLERHAEAGALPCRSFRSALSADNLQKMGYRNVWSLAGGIRAWREAGFPEEK